MATPVLNARNIENHLILDQRQLPSSVATLYTVPAGKEATVRRIKLVNMTGSQVTGIKLFATGTAAADQLYPTLVLDANEGIEYESDLDLATGTTVSGVAGTATAITCTVSGVEITV